VEGLLDGLVVGWSDGDAVVGAKVTGWKVGNSVKNVGGLVGPSVVGKAAVGAKVLGPWVVGLMVG